MKTTDKLCLTWRPADTAPKDGTEFQGWFESRYGECFWRPRCRYDEDGHIGVWGRLYYDHYGWDFDVGHLTLTHWMPQPEEPTEQEK